MLVEDERADRIRTLEEQALFVQALGAVTEKDGPKRVLEAYQGQIRRLRGETPAARPTPPLAAIVNDPYLAAIGARIARQARRRRKQQTEATPHGR
jgi:hypothetical protein